MTTMLLRRFVFQERRFASHSPQCHVKVLFSSNRTLPRPSMGSQKGPQHPQPPPPSSNPAGPTKQPFVKTVFDVGEWDPLTRSNPIYRPKFNAQAARIISADDFARRPPVGFTGEFANFEEAMLTVTWLTHKEQKEVYNVYTQMMLDAEQQKTQTSHEYVIRVLANKYKLTCNRVAAIIQLQHNEEQIIEQGGRVDQELADWMDAKVKEEIAAAYKFQKRSSARGPQVSTKPPSTFIEDPVAAGPVPPRDSRSFVSVSDLDIAKDDEALENERARSILEYHRYQEDVDPRTIKAPMDKDCKRLLETYKKMPHPDEDPIVLAQRQKNNAKEPVWPKPRRPRWDFICQTTTGRMENNNPVNTLVENDGELKAATVAQVQTVAWKKKRNDQEHYYANVQQAWIDRVNGSQEKVWGASLKTPVVFGDSEESNDASADSKEAKADGGEAKEEDEGAKEETPKD